jgi:hypothetical protein
VLHQEFSSLLPCPFNYGKAPSIEAPDGEGQDVIVIGPRLRPGTEVQVRPRLRVRFVDRGLDDDKLVARLDGRPLGLLDHFLLRVFFAVYGLFKRARYGFGGGPTGVRGYQAW